MGKTSLMTNGEKQIQLRAGTPVNSSSFLARRRRGSNVHPEGGALNTKDALKGNYWVSMWVVGFAVVLTVSGVLCGLLFGYFVYSSSLKEKLTLFSSTGVLINESVQLSMRDYLTAVSELQTYIDSSNGQHTRDGFQAHAENLLETIPVLAYQYVPRVFRNETAELIESSSIYWNNRLGTNQTWPIRSIVNGEMIPTDLTAEDYFVVKYIEPPDNNEAAINLDDLSVSPYRRGGIYASIDSGKPVAFAPLSLIQDTDPNSFGCLVQVPLKTEEGIVIAVVRFPEMVERVVSGIQEDLELHIFADGESVGGFAETPLRTIPPVGLDQLKSTREFFDSKTFSEMEKDWSLVICTKEGISIIDREAMSLIVTPAVLIFLFFLALTCYFLRSQRAATVEAQQKTSQALITAEREGRIVADAERQVNDYLAHEVRNPLSVAISANQFAARAIQQAKWPADSLHQATENDLHLVQTSLEFICDLMNNMLDANKVMLGTIELVESPISIRVDVLEPVRTMLNKKSSNVVLSVKIDGADGEDDDKLWVIADGLRLKQIIMNLAKNAVKFVDVGYIRLIGRRTNDGSTQLIVEDSGPGIPPSHRKNLFVKYQQSLDALRQGTGIGLYLVKAIVESMNGTILLDESYTSDLPGYPGSRFVITLPLRRPGRIDTLTSQHIRANLDNMSFRESSTCQQIRCLIIDDDAVVRNIFARILEKSLPGSHIEQAASGETGLESIQLAVQARLPFNVIFVDHYMPGPNNALNGEDTIVEIRKSLNCRAVVIGISANDVQKQHLEAGADDFLRKPIPEPKAVSELVAKHMNKPYLENILIVDDQEANRVLLQRTLTKFCCSKCKVHQASSGEEALKLAKKKHFDVIILDEHMGSGLTGSTTAGKMRAENIACSKTQPIFVSLSGTTLPADTASDFDIRWGKPWPPCEQMAKDLLHLLPRK